MARLNRARLNRDRALLDLVGDIYAAIDRPALWDKALKGYASLMAADAVAFLVADYDEGRVGSFFAHNIPDGHIRDYEDYYNKKDVWTLKAYRNRWPAGEAQLTQEFFPEDELERTEFYNDFLRPAGFYRACGAFLTYDKGASSVLTALRSRRAGLYEPQELQLALRVTPHFQRAVQLHRALYDVRQAGAAAMEVLDRLLLGVLFLDGRGRVVDANRAARRILERGDGLTADRQGTCRAASGAETPELRRLVQSAVATGEGRGTGAGGVMRLTRSSGARPFGLLVSPIGDGCFDLGARRAAAVILVFDPERRPEVPRAALARLYRLTGREADVTRALVAGFSLKEAAERLEISEGTARVYLKQVFQKTSTRRQSELMRLILLGPAGLG